MLSFYVGAIFRCAWVWQTTAEGAQEVLPVTLSFHVRSGSPDKESSSDSAPAEYAGICTRDMIASVFLRSGQSLDDPESLLPVTSTTFPQFRSRLTAAGIPADSHTWKGTIRHDSQWYPGCCRYPSGFSTCSCADHMSTMMLI